MTIYSQSLTVYVNADIPLNRGAVLLPALYCMAANAPGCLLQFDGNQRVYVGGGLATIARPITITIPSPTPNKNGYHGSEWKNDYSRQWRLDEERKADLLFVNGNVITITCDNFELYADCSYLIERARTRCRDAPGVGLGPGNGIGGMGYPYPPG